MTAPYDFVYFKVNDKTLVFEILEDAREKYFKYYSSEDWKHWPNQLYEGWYGDEI